MNKLDLPLALIAGLFLTVTHAWGQGTESGPVTSHVVDTTGGNVVWIGGPNDSVYGPAPFPIDLDPGGLPWTKAVLDTAAGSFTGGSAILYETILNSGTEPWTDWYETSFSSSTAGADWDTVLDLRVNGTSISFTSVIAGPVLTLDNFSQPVLPGDVLEIDKTMILTGTSTVPNTLLFRIEEYPTSTVPEPTLALLLIGGLAGIAPTRRRHER